MLFSRKNAPQRYTEKDIYFANEHLPDGGRDVLPDSDMVKAVHGYTSHFYEALGQRHDGTGRGSIIQADEKSMDETALLAFGILLEEAARDSLGRDGDLVFTEGVNDDDDDALDLQAGEGGMRGREGTVSRALQKTPVGSEGEESFWRRKYAKRRKTEQGKE